MSTKKTLGLVALPLVATLALAGCGDDGDSTPSSGGMSHQMMSDGASTSHNDQDVTFAQEMIPHHEQAITMARMARAHAGSAQVGELARRIEAAQRPEIETMKGWLTDWGADVPDSTGGMDGMDGMGHGSGMPGMMSDSDLQDLRHSSGSAFDEMFLRGMIAHHRGAVTMAEDEIAHGESPDAVDLARSIKDAQTREIAEMRRMLGS